MCGRDRDVHGTDGVRGQKLEGEVFSRKETDLSAFGEDFAVMRQRLAPAHQVSQLGIERARVEARHLLLRCCFLIDFEPAGKTVRQCRPSPGTQGCKDKLILYGVSKLNVFSTGYGAVSVNPDEICRRRDAFDAGRQLS